MSESSAVRVLAVGNHACSNIGDELLPATLKQWVEREGGELTAITLNPVHTELLDARKCIESMKAREAPADAIASANALTLFGRIAAPLRRVRAKLSKGID